MNLRYSCKTATQGIGAGIQSDSFLRDILPSHNHGSLKFMGVSPIVTFQIQKPFPLVPWLSKE